MAEKVYIDRNTVCEKLNAIGGCGAECDSWADGWDKAIEEAINIVNSVPTEKVVEVVRCKDCVHVDNGYIGHLYCRNFLSMPVYGSDYCKWGKQKEAASEKEAPVKHGHWSEKKSSGQGGIWDYYFVCSVCGGNTPDKAYIIAPDYCPNCGAKMDGGEGE